MAENNSINYSTTNHNLLIGNANNSVASLSNSTTGKILQANTGSDPSWVTYTEVGTVTGPVSSTDTAVALWNGAGGTVVKNSSLLVSPSGYMTNANQPCFMAYKSSNTTNATGNGTLVTVICDTIVTNRASGYNSGTGIFTAPVTGRYSMHFRVQYSNVVAQTNGLCQILVGAAVYDGGPWGPQGNDDPSGNNFYEVRAQIPMTAADTATFKYRLNNSTQTVTTVGSATLQTFVEGYLIC